MSEPRNKAFRIRADQIKDLAVGHGACIASDMITVDGRRVSFMYRETPEDDLDSGWRFFSGYESQEYMDDADNHALYDVNTIANYDRDIIPLLEAPFGSVFERVEGEGPLVEVNDFEPPQD